MKGKIGTSCFITTAINIIVRKPFIPKSVCKFCDKLIFINGGTKHLCSHSKICQKELCRDCINGNFSWPICKYCTKRINKPKQSFCSQTCASAGRINIKRPKKQYNKNCYNCHNDFITLNRNNNYCSDKCRINKQTERYKNKSWEKIP
jgi:hypothetical protein